MRTQKDLRFIIYKVHEDREIVVEFAAPADSTFENFKEHLTRTEPRFIAYDFPY